MIPIKSPEANKTLTRPTEMQEECLDLPIRANREVCISCWKMTWRERIKAILFGRVWLYVWQGYTQPPVALCVARTVFNMQEKKETSDERG